MNLEERIKSVELIGLIYDEKSRSFKGNAGRIDQDVVQYGSDGLFNKHYLKCKIKFEKENPCHTQNNK